MVDRRLWCAAPKHGRDQVSCGRWHWEVPAVLKWSACWQRPFFGAFPQLQETQRRPDGIFLRRMSPKSRHTRGQVHEWSRRQSAKSKLKFCSGWWRVSSRLEGSHNLLLCWTWNHGTNTTTCSTISDSCNIKSLQVMTVALSLFTPCLRHCMFCSIFTLLGVLQVPISFFLDV